MTSLALNLAALALGLGLGILAVVILAKPRRTQPRKPGALGPRAWQGWDPGAGPAPPDPGRAAFGPFTHRGPGKPWRR